MADIELVIKIPEELLEYFAKHNCMSEDGWFSHSSKLLDAFRNGTPLPKGHGRLIDVGKIDEDRIDHDNPVIYLTINEEYIEAVSLDYLNSLPTIIEADKAESEDKYGKI